MLRAFATLSATSFAAITFSLGLFVAPGLFNESWSVAFMALALVGMFFGGGLFATHNALRMMPSRTVSLLETGLVIASVVAASALIVLCGASVVSIQSKLLGINVGYTMLVVLAVFRLMSWRLYRELRKFRDLFAVAYYRDRGRSNPREKDLFRWFIKLSEAQKRWHLVRASRWCRENAFRMDHERHCATLYFTVYVAEAFADVTNETVALWYGAKPEHEKRRIADIGEGLLLLKRLFAFNEHVDVGGKFGDLATDGEWVIPSCDDEGNAKVSKLPIPSQMRVSWLRDINVE